MAFAAAALASAPSRYFWNVGQAANSSFNITAVVPEISGAARDSRVLLLTTYFGAYPCLDCLHRGRWCNGGVPQLANISYHEQQMELIMVIGRAALAAAGTKRI